MPRTEHHPQAQHPARKPSRRRVGSYVGVLIVLLLGLVGLSRQAEEPTLLPAPTATGAPPVHSPPDGTAPPSDPPPAGDEPTGDPPPSF